jgi:hypothetical protein
MKAMGRKVYEPAALPDAQAMKFAAITTVFLVWPAMFRVINVMLSV